MMIVSEVRRFTALLFLLAGSGCAGTGPSYSLQHHLYERQLPGKPPVVLVDLDDTVYEREVERPLAQAATCLQELARDHLVVYLTARPTYAKMPWVTHNRSDSLEFLSENGFPDGLLFTSSFCNWLFYGQGGGKVESFRQLREFGVDHVRLAVGDRPHDLEAYLTNPHVAVDHAVMILIEDENRKAHDRSELPIDCLLYTSPRPRD